MNITIKIIEKLVQTHVLIEAASQREANRVADRLQKNEVATDQPLLIKTAAGHYWLQPEEIYFIEIIKQELLIHLAAETLVTNGPMYKFLAQLDEEHFIQVHKSYVVNRQKLLRLENSFSGAMQACLTNQQHIPVSRRYFAKLKEKLSL